MLVEVRLEPEGLVALGADVGLLRVVRLLVGPQVGPVGKGLITNLAGEGLLAGVGPDVALEQPGPGEALAAVRTTAALVVGADVLGVGGHGDVDLVTVRALLGLLVLVRSKSKRKKFKLWHPAFLNKISFSTITYL